MNILLVSYYFQTGFQGSTSLIVFIANWLAKKGHKVWVLTHKFQNQEYKTHPNINFVFVSSELSFEGREKTSVTEMIRFSFAVWKKGLDIVKKEKIDIIHSNAIAGFPASLIAFFSSKPHIMLIHDLYSTDPQFWNQWQKQEGNSRINGWLGRLYEKILVKSKYSAIHTVSEASRNDLIKFGVKKPIYVIPNAIPNKDAQNTTINPYQFVHVGRLVFYKNIQVVIKSLKLLKEKFPKISLVIIGKGVYRHQLEKLVSQANLQKYVTFKGHVSEEEKNHLIASSQALVFPSWFEGFGLVILEAWHHKKPVLVSDVRPLSDIVENKKTGLVISKNNEKEWAEAIEYILSDQNNTTKMGISGREELETKYTIDSLGKQIYKMYEEQVINKK